MMLVRGMLGVGVTTLFLEFTSFSGGFWFVFQYSSSDFLARD